MTTTGAAFPFPLGIAAGGRITAGTAGEAIRGKIVQTLFTAPGERVNRPDFGCGLLDLVFDPNNVVLAAAMEFTIGQALSRWLKDDVLVEAVQVSAEDERAVVEVVYTLKRDLARQAVRVHFR